MAQVNMEAARKLIVNQRRIGAANVTKAFSIYAFVAITLVIAIFGGPDPVASKNMWSILCVVLVVIPASAAESLRLKAKANEN